MDALEIILTAVDNASKPIDAVKKSLGSLSEMGDRMTSVGQGMRNVGVGMLGVSAAGLAAFGGAVKVAADYESAMADVSKVLGEGAVEAHGLHDGFRELSESIPISASGLADIAASGAQLGVSADEILNFTEVTAQMATAFDMSADQAGRSIAKLQTALSLDSISEIAEVGDIFNHLSDNSGAAASEMVDVATRIGGTAKTFGLTTEEIGALSASFIELAPSPEIAATAINSILPALQTAESATPAFQDALEGIGFSASDMAQMIEQDAMGGLQTFIEELGKLDSATRATAIADMFGTGSDAALLNTLAGDAAILGDNLALVGDQSNYAGSMLNEFNTRSGTTSNQFELMKNRLENIAGTIGEALLPSVEQVLDVVEPLVDKFGEFVKNNPDIVRMATNFLLVGGAVGGTLLALGQLSMLLGSVSAGFKVLGMSMTFLKGGAIASLFTSIKTGLAGAVISAVGLGAALLGVVFSVFKIGAAFRGQTFTVSEFFNIIKDSVLQLPANLAQVPEAIGSIFSMMRTVAGFHLEGLKMRIQQTFNSMGTMASSAVSNIGSAFQGIVARMQAIWSQVKAGAVSGIQGVVSSIRNGGTQAVAAVVSMGSSIVSAITNIVGMARAAAARIGQAIADGLRSAIGAVQSAAGSLGAAIASALPGSPVKWGPLRVLNDISNNPGAQVATMIASGIESGTGRIQQAMGSLGAASLGGSPQGGLGFGGGRSAPLTTPFGGSSGGSTNSVSISYSPNIVIEGGSAGTLEQFEELLEQHSSKLLEMAQEAGSNSFRVSYGG